MRVDPARHDAAQIGDEALLLAVRAPCWVARDRAAGSAPQPRPVPARSCSMTDCRTLQSPRPCRSSSSTPPTVSAIGRVMPAGPLRERLARGLARADALVLLGTEVETNGSRPSQIYECLPVFPAVLSPVDGERLAGSRLWAFAGIGRPEKFFATLRALGAELVGARSFPDHHRFRTREIEQLLREAERTQARLVTTAKDIVRVPPTRRPGIEVLEVAVRWCDPDAIAALIKRVLGNQWPHGMA